MQSLNLSEIIIFCIIAQLFNISSFHQYAYIHLLHKRYLCIARFCLITILNHINQSHPQYHYYSNQYFNINILIEDNHQHIQLYHSVKNIIQQLYNIIQDNHQIFNHQQSLCNHKQSITTQRLSINTQQLSVNSQNQSINTQRKPIYSQRQETKTLINQISTKEPIITQKQNLKIQWSLLIRISKTQLRSKNIQKQQLQTLQSIKNCKSNLITNKLYQHPFIQSLMKIIHNNIETISALSEKIIKWKFIYNLKYQLQTNIQQYLNKPPKSKSKKKVSIISRTMQTHTPHLIKYQNKQNSHYDQQKQTEEKISQVYKGKENLAKKELNKHEECIKIMDQNKQYPIVDQNRQQKQYSQVEYKTSKSFQTFRSQYSLKSQQYAHNITKKLTRMLRYCQYGFYANKCNYHKQGIQRRFIKISLSMLKWSKNPKTFDQQCQLYPLKDIQFIVYGKLAPNFHKTHINVPNHLCFSLQLKKRTLDLFGQRYEEVQRWVCGISLALKKVGCKCIGYTPGKLKWIKAFFILKRRFIEPLKLHERNNYYYQNAYALIMFKKNGYSLEYR